VKRSRRKRFGKLRLLLSLLCLGLLTIIYDEIDRPEIEPAANAAPASAMPKPAEGALNPSFAILPVGEFAEVLARPLFSQTRRAPLEGKQAPTPPASPFVLVGIVISADGRHALIEHGQPARLVRIAETQQLDGWIIEAILPGKVIVRLGDNREEVKLKEKSPYVVKRANAAPVNAAQQQEGAKTAAPAAASDILGATVPAANAPADNRQPARSSRPTP